jgi:hypothetical protein
MYEHDMKLFWAYMTGTIFAAILVVLWALTHGGIST